ncbi:MAG: cell division protein ZipA, partial [Marinobacter sp.]
MSLREWLIAIGTLVIIGIVIDGLRRMRRARKESMAISSGMGADELDESPLDSEHNPELPNGGARTISRDTLEERGYLKRERPNRFGNPVQKPTRPIISDEERIALAERYDEPDDSNDDVEPVDEVDHDTGHRTEDTGWGAIDDEVEVDEGIIGEPRVVEEPTRKSEPEPQPEPSGRPGAKASAPPLV